MRPKTTQSRSEAWIALALCTAVFVAGVVELLLPGRPAYADSFAPDWLPLAAAGMAAAGIGMRLHGHTRWSLPGGALSGGGLLLMLTTASGMPLDVLRAASLVVPGLMPPGIDWLGLVTRTLALAAVVVLGHRALSCPASPASARAASWYGFAAFALALPYPVLKTWWALGGSLGLRWPGAFGLAGSFCLMAARRPVAAGRRPIAASGADAALVAAPAVAGRRLVRHGRRRHDRPSCLLVARQRAGQRYCRLRRNGRLGLRSLLRKLAPLGHRCRRRHPRLSGAHRRRRGAGTACSPFFLRFSHSVDSAVAGSIRSACSNCPGCRRRLSPARWCELAREPGQQEGREDQAHAAV